MIYATSVNFTVTAQIPWRSYTISGIRFLEVELLCGIKRTGESPPDTLEGNAIGLWKLLWIGSRAGVLCGTER